MPTKPKPKKVESIVANRIRLLRESLGMTQTAFATAMGTKPNKVSQWEAGINKPSPDALVKIARMANGIDKIFFLDHAGIPEEYFFGKDMISEIRDAATEVIAKTLSDSASTLDLSTPSQPPCIVLLLKNTKKLGDAKAMQSQDVEAQMSFPPYWFPKGSTIQAVRFPQLISPFITGDVIALVDVSRRDPDRLAGSIVVVRTPKETEPMTLRKDGGTYFLVPLREDADHQVRILRQSGSWSIVGRVVRWIGEAPSGRK